jgi:hypothetical protein
VGRAPLLCCQQGKCGQRGTPPNSCCWWTPPLPRFPQGTRAAWHSQHQLHTSALVGRSLSSPLWPALGWRQSDQPSRVAAHCWLAGRMPPCHTVRCRQHSSVPAPAHMCHQGRPLALMCLLGSSKLRGKAHCRPRLSSPALRQKFRGDKPPALFWWRQAGSSGQCCMRHHTLQWPGHCWHRSDQLGRLLQLHSLTLAHKSTLAHTALSRR